MIALAIVSAALASLSSLPTALAPGGGPTMANLSRLRSPVQAAHHKRGVVTLFEDTFGDPVPQGITTGPDGALWFTDIGNDVIGRITVQGTMTQFGGGGVELSDGIITGPDGALWFTVEQSDAQIGRITTSGAVTLFPDPGGAFPQAITTGPDGALWYGESNGTVGRITTSGAVTRFTVGPSNAEMAGIVAGPDGALWITEAQAGSRESDHVVRLTTKGKKKSYTVGFGPSGICVGPDGALWFAEEGSAAIGRLTTTGHYKEFVIQGPSVAPLGIAAGPDGALWFTNFNGATSEIGRLTTAGRMTFFKIPGSFPEADGITRGPDGAMWFTSVLDPPAIGRITTR